MAARASDKAAGSSDVVRARVSTLVQMFDAARHLPLPRGRKLSTQGGDRLSKFRGRGMEYDESRPYQVGDDIRLLDWRVTARTGRAHTKLFREERERPVFLWVDYRPSMFFATRGMYKSVLGARAASLLAWRAMLNGDRVGGMIFSDDRHHELKPERGRPAVLHLIRQLVACQEWADTDPVAPSPDSDDNPLYLALARLRRLVRPGAMIFLLSDFRNLDEAGEEQLALLARHCNLALLLIHDPLERRLPPPGQYRVTDGHGELTINAANRSIGDAYRARFEKRLERLDGTARKYGLALLRCETDVDLAATLQLGLGGLWK